MALKAMDATPLGAVMYDFLHWGGPVARARGAETVQQIRGAANLGSSTGMRVQQHLLRRFDTITKGLGDEERVNVAKALNGELPVMENPSVLTPREQSAYRQQRISRTTPVQRQKAARPDPEDWDPMMAATAGVILAGTTFVKFADLAEFAGCACPSALQTS